MLTHVVLNVAGKEFLLMISVLSSLVLCSSGTLPLIYLYIFYSILHVQKFLC